MRFGEPQTTEATLVLLRRWQEQKAELAACFAAAGGGVSITLRGRIVRLSKARLVFESDNAQLAFNLLKCRFDYGPLDFVAWPGNRMRSVNGLHIVTDRAHWLFLAERSDATFPVLQGS
jgi:hypothetical protein